MIWWLRPKGAGEELCWGNVYINSRGGRSNHTHPRDT